MGTHGDSLRAAQTTPSSRTQSERVPTQRRQSRRAEAARRNRRLFLEPLELRALLTVTAFDDAYFTNEDEGLYITAEGLPDTAPNTWIEWPGVLYYDSPPTGLTAELVGEPVFGEVILHPDGSFEYTPLGNSTETDTFTYRATDGVNYSELATVEIHIAPVNDAPEAMADGYTAYKNIPLNVPASGVLFNDWDVDNLVLTASQGEGPAHGTLTFNANGSFIYVPEAGYLGSDEFTYVVSDGLLESTGTVSITVVDQPPDVPPKAYTVQKNTPLHVPVAEGLLEGVTDPGDPGVSFYALATSGPQHGTVDVNPDGSFTYTPNQNYTGSDTFGAEIGIAGGGGMVAQIIVGINVLQVNQPPVAGNDVFNLDEDNVLSGSVLANDDDPDTTTPLTASLVSGVSNGTLTFNPNGTFLYTPNLNWFGTDIFTYTIADDGQPSIDDLPPGALPIGFTVADYTTLINLGGPLTSIIATVTIIVAPINDLPVTIDLTFGMDEDTQLLEPGGMFIGVTDPDNPPSELTPIITTPPPFGIIVISPGGSIIYTPDPGFVGSVGFGFIITDPIGSSNPGTGTIVVEPVNDPPVAVDDAFTLDEDALYFAGGVGGNDTDPDGPSLTWSLGSGVSHGSLILNSDGSFNYTPAINYHGSDSFTYTVTDGSLSASASVSLTIQAVSDAPVAVDDAFATDEDTPVSGSLIGNDFDPDNDPLTLVTLQTNPTNGSLLFDPSGSFTYTPNANYHGADTFTYNVTDSTSLQSNVATVTITVSSINDAPTAQDQSFTLDEDTSLTISESALLDGATDPDGDALSVTIIDQPLHGTLTLISSGGYGYTPNSNYNGVDSFFFGVSDGSLLATGTANLIVNGVDEPPLISLEGGIVDEGEVAEVTFRLSAVSTVDVAINYLTADNTASVADGDYIAITGSSVLIPAGSTFATIPILTGEDSIDEEDEVFGVILQSASNALYSNDTAFVIIQDDDSYFTIQETGSAEEPSGLEDEESLAFTITFTDPMGAGGFVSWVADVPASPISGYAGELDFIPVHGVAAFAPGETSVVVYVPVLFDKVTEPVELVTVHLLEPSPGSIIQGASDTGTILDTPYIGLPTIEASAVQTAVSEGDTIMLTGALQVPVGDMPSEVFFFDEDTDEGLGSTSVSSAGQFSWAKTVADDNPTGSPEDYLNIKVVATVIGDGTSVDVETAVSVLVVNVNPTVDVSVFVPIDPTNLSMGFQSGSEIESGGTVRLVIDSADVGVEDGRTITVNWGDQTQYTVLTIGSETVWPLIVQHQYPEIDPLDPNPPQSFDIEVTADDDDGGASSVHSSLLVASTDNEVWLVAGDGDASEIDASNTGKFTIHRSGNTSDPLVVSLENSGAATSPLDFDLFVDSRKVSGGIRFEPNVSELEVTLVAKNEHESDPDESAIFVISPSVKYAVSTTSPSVAIAIADTADFIEIRSMNSVNEDDGKPLIFEIRATSRPANGLPFNVEVETTLYENGELATSPGGPFGAGIVTLTPTATGAVGYFKHVPWADGKIEKGDNYLRVQLTNWEVPAQYRVNPDFRRANGTIIDDDDFGLTVALSSISRPEDLDYYNHFLGTYSANYNVFDTLTVTRTGSTKFSKSIWIENLGEALLGKDYLVYYSKADYYSLSYYRPGTDWPATAYTDFVIPAGKSSVTLYLYIKDDKLFEGDEDIDVRARGTGASTAISNTATLTIVDDDDDAISSASWELVHTSTVNVDYEPMIWKDGQTGVDAGEWAFRESDRTWNRIVKRRAWEVVGSDLAIKETAANKKFAATDAMGYTLTSGSSTTFSVVGKLPVYKKLEIQAGATHSFTNSTSNSTSARFDPDAVTTDGDTWKSQILRLRTDVFMQKVYGMNDSSPPASGQAGDTSVSVEVDLGKTSYDSTFGAAIYKKIVP